MCQKEEYEVLKPTLANLFGLEVRFKELDQKMKRQEKGKRKLFQLSVSKSM